MKDPFRKKSFWIILISLFLIIILFPPFHSVDNHGWKFVFNFRVNETIWLRRLSFEIMIAFLLNYMGHLIFRNTRANKGILPGPGRR